jgi:negative regulator of replication initiation
MIDNTSVTVLQTSQGSYGGEFVSHVVRLDDDIWEYLKRQPVTLGDDHNDLLRRLLKLSAPKPTTQVPRSWANGGRGRGVLGADKDYANLPISGYEFEGKNYQIRTFKEVLIGICESLRTRHANQFDEVALQLHGKKRSYFARTDSDMKHPRELSGSGVRGQTLFVESNLSATSIMGLCQHLIRTLGHDLSTFKVH